MRALLIAVTITAGCATAPVDADREYAREDARIRAFEEFETFKQACRARGGITVVDKVGRLASSAFDPRTARCTGGWVPAGRR